MKYIFLFLIPACFLISCKNEIISEATISVSEYQKNRKTINVYGNVKKIECINYQQFVPNSELHNYTTKTNLKFNKKGNLIEETTYLENEKFSLRSNYFYDEMNNLIKTEFYDEMNNLIGSETNYLNEKGILIKNEIKNIRRDGLDRTIYYSKYEKLTDTLKIYYSHTIENESHDSTKYVEAYKNGNLISKITDEGIYSYKSEYKYDNRNNKIFYSDSSVAHLQIWEFEYDNENRIIKWLVRNNKNGIKNETFKFYDKLGNITKEVFYKNGTINEKNSYQDIYEYDKEGNWTKRTRLKLNGDKISILEREITYY